MLATYWQNVCDLADATDCTHYDAAKQIIAADHITQPYFIYHIIGNALAIDKAHRTSARHEITA